MSMIRIAASAFLFALLATLPGQPASATVLSASEQFSCDNVTEIPKSECEVLVALYNETDGPNWQDTTGWLETNVPCSWYGVTCDGGHIIELNLSGLGAGPEYFGLKGDLPTEIGNLDNLTTLNLNVNQLSSLPSEIGNLNNLTWLELSSNQLSNLPSSIGNLDNLISLDLGFNQLSSLPSSIGDLNNLIWLHLYYNELNSLPSSIDNLNNLSDLNLGSNQLSSLPTSIGNLNNLEFLRLSDNQLSSLPSSIGNLNKLIWLDLDSNQLDSFPSSISELNNLETLYLSNNQLSSLPSSIGNLNKLTELYLHSNQLSSLPSSIDNLNNLLLLNLDSNQLNSLPTSIGDLNDLKELSLEDNCLEIAVDFALLQWVNERDPDWASTQSLNSSKCELPSTDLIADKIEVTQGIQDLNNSVRLVKDKRTYVRFHISSSDGWHSTTAKLIAQQGGNQTELLPLNSEGQVTVQKSPNRSALDDAFLFELPEGYQQNNVTLTAILNPNNSPAESDSNNNNISVTVNFEPVPDQNLVIAGIGYGDGIYPSDFHKKKLESWLEKAYPVANYNVIYRDYFYNLDEEFAYNECIEINKFLQRKRTMDFASGSATRDTRYYGMVDDEGVFVRGKAGSKTISYVSCGPTGSPTNQIEFQWDKDSSYGDWYGGHELAHNYGREHAPFCKDALGPPYPHPNGWISPVPTGDDAIYGFDLDTKEIYGPDWTDVMTYCDKQWISDFTYEALMDHFQTPRLIAASATSSRMDRLLVIGTIDPRTNDVRLEPLSIIRNVIELKERVPNGYAIVLRNDAGNELARYGFTPDIIESGPGLGNEEEYEFLGIYELVPYVERTVRVDIEKLGQVIKTVEAGWTKPSVTLDAASVADGLVIEGDTIYLSWSGSDSDGDTISYLVQYSADNGQTWEVMTPYTTDTSARIRTSNIENINTALFRVVATDGINTTNSDVSSTSQDYRPDHLYLPLIKR